jgi:hypothetical protein
MTTSLYNYTYTSPSGSSYSGQVVADTSMPQYNYMPGQTYNAPNGGSYAISGSATPTSAPSGAVYQTSYTAPSGMSYDSYHYDPATASYYDVKTLGYSATTGMYTPPSGGSSVPMWSGIGLGNEYSYVNTGTASAPSYQTYGGGGTAMANLTPSTPTMYDYQFMYSNGSYYDGKVVDNGTYGYKVGQTMAESDGTYTIYAQDPSAPSTGAQAGYNYVELYHDATSGTNYAPSDIVPSSPYYQKPVGYGGMGTEKDYIQKPGGYYAFNDTTPASTSTPVASIPLPT